MPEDLHDIESALRSLRPRSPNPTVAAGISRALVSPAPTSSSRKKIITWVSLISAAAACFIGVILFRQAPELNPLNYQLVRAEQSPATIDLLSPVKLEDGSFARPVRVYWNNQTHWEDSKNQTQLIQQRPQEQFALIPLQIY